MVELKLTLVHSGGSCSPYTIKPYVRDNLSVGTDSIDVDNMKTKYPHLEPVLLHKYSYADVDMILGQDVFHFIHPLEYFDSDCKNARCRLSFVGVGIKWTSSSDFGSVLGVFQGCYENKDADTKLVDQLRSWYSADSKIAQFPPFIGPNGLIRASGRTKHLSVAIFDVKLPVVLDSRHPMLRLLSEHLPKKHFHQGVDYLRALVQQRFAVVKLRTTLRTIVSRCITCLKRRAETSTPMMLDLPRERLAFEEPPFSNTGIDHFGLFFVSVKRSTEKRWGFLFNYLTTRAVHFEVVLSMDTSSCVIGIKRFCARRGFPSVIWSDNCKNFVASEKELLYNINTWNQQVLKKN